MRSRFTSSSGDRPPTRARSPRRGFGLSTIVLAKAALALALLGTTAGLERCTGRLVIPGIGSVEGEWSNTDVTIIDIPAHFERCGQGRDDKTGRTYCVWCDPNDPFHVYHDWDCDRRRGEIWSFERSRTNFGTARGTAQPSIDLVGSIRDPRSVIATITLDRDVRIPANAFTNVEVIAPGMRVDVLENLEFITFEAGLPIMVVGSLHDLLDLTYHAGIRSAITTIAGQRAEIRTASHGAIVELLVDDTVVASRVVGAESE